MSEEEKREIVEAYKSIMRYRQHRSSCEYYYADVCTCGMMPAARRVRAIIDKIEGKS